MHKLKSIHRRLIILGITLFSMLLISQLTAAQFTGATLQGGGTLSRPTF